MPAEGDVDLIVSRELFPDGKPGVFLEIGAAHPEYLSIGAHFRRLDWRVISIEPNPKFAQLHRALGHEIYEYACGETDQDDAEFVVAEAGPDFKYLYEGEKVTGESFSSLGIRGQYQKLFERVEDTYSLTRIPVQVRRIDTILRELGIERLDLLALDVEGWELECLKGFSFGQLAPKVAIIENLFDEENVRNFMSDHGYEQWRVIPPNDVYVLSRPT